MAVKTQVVELMQEDIRERTEELRQVKNNLPEYDIERGRRGIANMLKKMLPVGVPEISSMSDDSGEIVTAPEDIAGCLNNHWQHVLDEKNTVRPKRMEWLEEIRSKLKVSKDQLRPTRKLVRQVIKKHLLLRVDLTQCHLRYTRQQGMSPLPCLWTLRAPCSTGMLRMMMTLTRLSWCVSRRRRKEIWRT